MANDSLGSKYSGQTPMWGKDESTGKIRIVKVTSDGKMKTDASVSSSPPSTTVLRSSTTGAGAVSYSTAFAKKMKIRSVTGKASGAVVEALTLTLDSLTGAAYDAPLPTVAAGWTGFVWLPEGDLLLEAGDEIALSCANSGSATWGVEIIAEELS